MWTCFSRSRVLVALWLFLNIMDMVTTRVVVGAGGLELLPVSRVLLEWAPAGFILFKIVAPLSILPLLYWLGRFHLLRLLDLFLGIVVLWNVVLFIVML